MENWRSQAIVYATRSRSVARIANRTASQHFWESCDIIGHLIDHMPFSIGSPFERSLYLPAVFEDIAL